MTVTMYIDITLHMFIVLARLSGGIGCVCSCTIVYFIGIRIS